MNVTKIACALAMGLAISGAVVGQANAAVIGVQSATSPIVFEAGSITSHTIVPNGSSMAAKVYNTDTTAATGRIVAGAGDDLAIKWDPACGVIDPLITTECTVTVGTDKVKFSIAAVTGTLAPVAGEGTGIDAWYGTGASGNMSYLVQVVGNGQAVAAGTFPVIVDAGVVTP